MLNISTKLGTPKHMRLRLYPKGYQTVQTSGTKTQTIQPEGQQETSSTNDSSPTTLVVTINTKNLETVYN